MKKLKIACAAFFVIISSCTNSKTDTGVDFIPGVYVKEIRQEFSHGKDTLLINVFDKDAGTYTIVRKTSYQQQIDGQKFPPKRERHQWIAVYDPVTKQLREQNKEKTYFFSEEKGLLLTGGSEYKKVEDF
jgi:hypothetical protein